jgi:hypothetical protein
MNLEFDHIGFVTDTKKGDEDFVEATRVWVTDPKSHPYNIEWLRYEPDSPVTGPLREYGHIAYRVDDLEEAAKGLKVVLEPFEVGGFVKVGFYETGDGAVVEFMEYLKGANTWFGKEH